MTTTQATPPDLERALRSNNQVEIRRAIESHRHVSDAWTILAQVNGVNRPVPLLTYACLMENPEAAGLLYRNGASFVNNRCGQDVSPSAFAGQSRTANTLAIAGSARSMAARYKR